MKRTLKYTRVVLLAILLSTTALAQIEITLKNTFIEKFKNRVTIDTNFTVDKAHKKPNPPSKDADMHVAGRAPEIGLATVAEIMNAKDHAPDAVDAIKAAEGTGQPVRMSGVWRFWCEHSGGAPQVQGKALRPFTTTNPDHVFEIHPVTSLGALSLLDTLIPIKEFQTKDAERAFNAYERVDSEIVPGRTTTKILTEMAGFNYVEFILRLNTDDQFVVPDGRMVFASVHTLEGELLVRNRRMVFVKGSPAELRVKGLKEGDALHVLGIPRINLSLVSWRSKNFRRRAGALKWNLPYEIIIAGVYSDTPEVELDESR